MVQTTVGNGASFPSRRHIIWWHNSSTNTREWQSPYGRGLSNSTIPPVGLLQQSTEALPNLLSLTADHVWWINNTSNSHRSNSCWTSSHRYEVSKGTTHSHSLGNLEQNYTKACFTHTDTISSFGKIPPQMTRILHVANQHSMILHGSTKQGKKLQCIVYTIQSINEHTLGDTITLKTPIPQPTNHHATWQHQ